MSVHENRNWPAAIAALSTVVVFTGCIQGELEISDPDTGADVDAADGGDAAGDSAPRGDGAGDRPCCLNGSCVILARRSCRLRGGTVQSEATCSGAECG